MPFRRESSFSFCLRVLRRKIRPPPADPIMAEIETLGILDEIQAIVSDRLQVVSYKWLSRNFLVSSNAAKRLLQEFVEKHGSGLEVVYTLSGWLRNNPSAYHIRLVSKPNLEEAKLDFDDNCSVQVYSVQACIPKDPAALWNAEFVQAEELFKQPPSVDNCLRDNRFCGVSNSFIKRNAEGIHVNNADQAKSGGGQRPLRSNPVPQTVPQPQQTKSQQSKPNNVVQSPSMVKETKSESHGTGGDHEQASKIAADKEKVPQLAANNKKVQNDKNSSGSGGSLADMWGRASTKSKPSSTSAQTNQVIANSADAEICAREALEDGSSDDDVPHVKTKRASNGDGNRKRRVVFDFSDEEEECKDAVNLGSPDPPRKQPFLDSKQYTKTPVLEKNNLNFDEQEEYKQKVKKEREIDKISNQLSSEEPSVVSKGGTTRIPSPENIQSRNSESDTNPKDRVTNAAPNSPKRRKVLKTWIDERGREVTEVMLEGDETETKPNDSTVKKTDNNTESNALRRPPPASKKPPAVGTAALNPVGKTGSKKAGTKDPKQGNILSFFKKV